MSTEEFEKIAKDLITFNFYKRGHDPLLEVLWMAHMLGNEKAIFCNVQAGDSALYEVTWSVNTSEFYVNRYGKTDSVKAGYDGFGYADMERRNLESPGLPKTVKAEREKSK